MYDSINPAEVIAELPETFGSKLNMEQNMAHGSSAATQIPLSNTHCKRMIISPKIILATAIISLLSISSPANAQEGDGPGSIPTDIEGIRLVNGIYGNMGRVEVLYNGTWGTICDDSWSISDTRVACRMLGYEGAVCAIKRARFGAADISVPILMDDMWCRGSEKALDHCYFDGWGNHDCTHREDAGVICEDSSLSVTGTPDNIRLIESSTKSLTVGWTIPVFPKGVEAIRFRFSYRSKANTYTRTRYFYPSLNIINSTGAEINYTLSPLQTDTEYSIRIRAEAVYTTLCPNLVLTGSYSDAVVLRTNNTYPTYMPSTTSNKISVTPLSTAQLTATSPSSGSQETRAIIIAVGLVGGGLLLVVVIPTIVCLVLKWKARNLSTNAESNPNTSIEGEEANIDNIITSTNAAYQKTIIANTEIKVIINPVERTTKLQQSTENWDSKLNMEQNVAYELSATAPVSFYRSNITYCMSRKLPEDNDHTDDQYDNI